jgi:hypothetical protein
MDDQRPLPLEIKKKIETSTCGGCIVCYLQLAMAPEEKECPEKRVRP